MPYILSGGSLLLPLQIGGYTFEKQPYTGSIDNRISAQLLDQLPDFIASDYETFTAFLEAYYEWSEQYGNPRAEGVRLLTYKDIDETLDEFVDYFRETYIKNFPFTKADGINEKSLIKNIGDFYRSKGSIASFRLLFRILYDTEIEIDFPKDRILKLSESTFDDRKYLRIEPNFSLYEAKEIEGNIVFQKDPRTETILGSALVDEVVYQTQNSIDFYALRIKDVSGSFNISLPVEIETSGITISKISAKIFPTLDSVIINESGQGYEVGDLVTFKDQYNNDLLKATINTISPIGGIRGLKIKNFYGIYVPSESISYSIETAAGEGAGLSAGSQTIISAGPDTYLDDSGKLSGRSFIQDSYFYQNYSYIIKVDKTLNEFSNIIKKLAHPAGTIMFAEFVNSISMTGSSYVETDVRSKFVPIIGHYLPHTFGMTLDPRGFTHETGAGSTFYDFYPRGYNGQDGSTLGEFIPKFWSSITHGTPHLFPTNGITHDPYKIYTNDDSAFLFDQIEFTRALLNGAIGSTGYIGQGVDSNQDYTGLYGVFPIGSSIASALYGGSGGVTHYGGYTSPTETSLSGGFSGGQVIMVGDTDSSTADYWVVHRHPNTIGIENIGITTEHKIIKIPMSPVEDPTILYTATEIDRTGYSNSTYQNSGFTLNIGATYTVGEIVRQKRYREGEAIGRVINFEAGAYSHGPYGQEDPRYNDSIDYLTVEMLNGEFTKGNDLTQIEKPIVGDTSGSSRFIDNSYNPTINTMGIKVVETSWLEIPIRVIADEIEYSLFES